MSFSFHNTLATVFSAYSALLNLFFFGDVMQHCSIIYHTNGVPGFHPLQWEAFTSCIITVQKINGDLFLPICVCVCVPAFMAHYKLTSWNDQAESVIFNPYPSSNKWSGATSHLQVKKEILECAVGKKKIMTTVFKDERNVILVNSKSLCAHSEKFHSLSSLSLSYKRND